MFYEGCISFFSPFLFASGVNNSFLKKTSIIPPTSLSTIHPGILWAAWAVGHYVSDGHSKVQRGREGRMKKKLWEALIAGIGSRGGRQEEGLLLTICGGRGSASNACQYLLPRNV